MLKHTQIYPQLATNLTYPAKFYVAPSVGCGTVVCHMTLIGYARVSTADQTPLLQTDALERAGCEKIWSDMTGGTGTRPELKKAMSYLRKGDTLVVWRLDRLGRSVTDLLAKLEDLDKRGIGFKSVSESIDTTNAMGRLVVHMLASIAEFERDLIRERTMAGLIAARARGRVGGRRPVMNEKKLAVAREMYESKAHTGQEIADTLNVSRTTIFRWLSRDHS